MSKKISEYFKIQQKVNENSQISSNILDCKVVLNDIKNQIGKNKLKLFEEVVLNNSQKKESKSRSIKCPICNLKFIQVRLKLHMKKKHPDGQAEQFECDIDGKIFINKGSLYCHMVVHLSLVECKICNKMLKQSNMKSHLKNFHATDKNFKYEICSKAFKSLRYLNIHGRIHNKTHKCDICNKMFSYAYDLNTHKKEYHENVKSFKCEICNKKFNQKGTLKDHQNTHDKNRPKPFKCLRCDFATDHQTNFVRHQKSNEHQDGKIAAMKNPIKCEKCPTFCKNKKALSKHIHRVHPKVLFQYDLCAKFIKVRSHLLIHFKVHIQKFKDF